MELTREYLYKHYIVQGKSEASIAKELGIGRGKVGYWIDKFGLYFKKSDPDKVFNLKHIDFADPIFCYYAGLIATDGYLDYKNKRISLRVNNIGSYEVFENLRCYFEFIRPITTYYRDEGKGFVHDLTIPNKCIFDELEKMGIYGYKDNRTFDINWFTESTPSCRYMFLRGVSDGDGSFHTNSFRLSMKPQSFVENLIYVFNTMCQGTYTLGYTSNSTGKKYPNVTLRKADTLKIFGMVYDGFEQYRFMDKYNAYCRIVDR